MAQDNNWTHEQTIIAISLYDKIPYNKISGTNNQKIKTIAKIIGKTPAALAFKLMNLSSLDPERGFKGKSNASKRDKEIWNEYHGKWEELAMENALALAKLEHKKIEEIIDIDNDIKEGKEKERLVKVRVNQYDFRERILANYNEVCCITGIALPELLVASHIKAWSIDKTNRLNPNNGLCLNSFHDKAFDRGLITITPDYKIKLSPEIKARKKEESINDYFIRYDNNQIILPSKYSPDPDFLRHHNQNVFRR